MRTDPIDSLIRRVAGDAEVGQGAIRLRLDQNGVVSGARSLFGDFLRTFAHYDVFEERTASGPVEIGPLTIDLPSAGGRAHVQVVLSNARVARGKAPQLATALFHQSQTPSERFSQQMKRIAGSVVSRSALRLATSFQVTARDLSQEIAREISACMGVSASVALRRLGVRTRGTVGPAPLVVDLKDFLAVPISVKVELDDDQDRLAPAEDAGGGPGELALIQHTVSEALRERVGLQELVSAMPRVQARVTQDLKVALARIGRRVLLCELTLKLEIPRRGVNLRASSESVVGERRFQIVAEAIATPRDAVRLARAPISDMPTWWRDRVALHAAEVLPRYDHGTILLGFDPIGEVLSALLLADLEQHGYETARVRTICTDTAPRMQHLLPVRATLSIRVGVNDQLLGVTLLAQVECTDRKLWVNHGEPDLAEIVTSTTRGWMEGKLRIEDHLVALRHFESHRQDAVAVVQAALAPVGARLAPRPGQGPALRLEPADSHAVVSRVAYDGVMDLRYDGGARTAEVSFTGVAELLPDGRWVYLAAPVPLRELLLARTRELMDDAFRGVPRESAITGFDARVKRVRSQLEQELQLRGYALQDLAVRAPSLVVYAPPTVDVPFTVSTHMGKAADTVTLQGVLELTLTDRAAWLREGEPEIADWSSRHVRLVFERVIRAAVPSQVDTAPEALRERIETQLRPFLAQIGYQIRAMPSHLSASPARPSDFEEVVAPIHLHMRHREREVRAVVQMKLASVARWRDAGVRDVQSWAIEQINAITKTRLFKESYTSLLEEAEYVDGSTSTSGQGPFVRIEQEMNQLAHEIGYTVAKVMTLDDGESARLLAGFPLHVHGVYTSAIYHHAFSMHVRGEARARRLDDIRALLDRDVPVIQRAHEAINTRLQAHIAKLNPNDLAFRFAHHEDASPSAQLVPSSRQTSLRDGILCAVVEVLQDLGLEGVDLSVQMEMPEIFKRIQPLRGQTLELNLDLPPRRHRIALSFKVVARIDDLSPLGQDLDMAYLPSIEELHRDLERYLTAQLAEWGANDLVVSAERQFAQLNDDIDQLIRGYSFSRMKVNMVLDSLLRNTTFLDGEYERKQVEARDAYQYFEEQRRILRQHVVALMGQRDYPAAAEAQRQLDQWEKSGRPRAAPPMAQLNGGRGGGGLLTEDDQPLGDPVTLTVHAPQGGYTCSDEELPIHLDVELVYCPTNAALSAPAKVTSAVEETVQSVLRDVDPLQFYLGFGQRYRGRMVLQDLTSALRRALIGTLADQRGTCDLRFHGTPDNALADLRRQLQGSCSHFSAPLDQGLSERAATLEVDVEVDDVAFGGLARFQDLAARQADSRGAGRDLKSIGEKIVKNAASAMSVEAASALDEAGLGDLVCEAFRREVGLAVRASGARVRRHLTESEEGRLMRIKNDIDRAETQRHLIEADNLQLHKAKDLAELDERVALLQRQRQEILAKVS